MSTTALQQAILQWGANVDRPLPWRGERDPYRVLVSEIMLQQTQASRVVSAYQSWIARFPTLETLAAASQADVLREWGTLGYPRRARMLWQIAHHHSALPATVDGLLSLPGVGPYTARAVAAFCFGVDAAPVEANIRRVFTRVHGLAPDASVDDLAASLLPAGRAAAWNQAVMDLGATVCKPRTPLCDVCPIATSCAWQRGVRPARLLPRRQAPEFETTMRYARGRVMARLREGPASTRAIAAWASVPHDRVKAASEALLADGLIARVGEVFRLG